MHQVGLGVIFFLFINNIANSAATLKMYQSVKDTQDFKIYINGVGDGLSLANAELMTTSKSPLYCQPSTLALRAENYLQILRDYIAKNWEKAEKSCGADCPITILLLMGLKETFPCK